MQPLCLVEPSLFLVLTGPSGSPEPRRELDRLRTACAKPSGEQPLWAPEPVFSSFRGSPAQVRAHVRDVVEPALVGGTPVVLEGGWWPEHSGDSVAEAITAGMTAWGSCCPTLTVVFPHDGEDSLSRLTAWAGPAAAALQPAHEAYLSLQVFDALARRGLYRANGWLHSRHSGTTHQGSRA